MIEIKNVTKIYKVKNKSDCIAVNDVTFTLPDKGMVFVIGKSGSGKSTLLNLIGGLDTCTSGEITADGNVITKMKNRELTKYRSSYVGFIFQDYHILENFTVRQNINLSLDISNNVDEEKVNKILQVVDLTMYADRYPSELSGGQKQRISIARALVKDAKVILCDEPTGNLDKKTSTQVLDMLKKISQEKLVVIVSHSMVDANNYADRIIELYDGAIVRDRQRSNNYSNEFRIEEGTIYLPHYRDLTSNELILINETIQKEDELKFKQINNRFYETSKITKPMEKVELVSSKVSRKTSKKLFSMFFKHKKASIIFSVLLASILMVCFAIFQSFLSFDGNMELSKSLTKQDIYTIPLQKGITDGSGNIKLGNIQPVLKEDIDSYYNNGFDGKIYIKYNSTLPISVTTSTIDNEGTVNISSNLSLFYTKESFGVINCDYEFLTSLFGKNGELKMLAGDITGEEYGILIPDYLADAILFYSNDKTKTYEDLIGVYNYGGFDYNYINGIFDTEYDIKYAELIAKFKSGLADPTEAGRVYNELKNTNLFTNFLVDAMNYLCYGYSISENYQLSIEDSSFRSWLRLNEFELSINEDTHTFSSSSVIFHDAQKYNVSLGKNEMIMSLATYNKLFSTSYETLETFTPRDITFKFYDTRNQEGNIVYTKTYHIVSLTNKAYNLVNIEDSLDLRKYDIIQYGIYLNNHNNIEQMMKVANETGYLVCSADATKITTINKVLDVFEQFFLFIELFFLAVTVIFLVNIGLSSVKKNKYEIGVLKAIGTSSFDIVRIFIRQSLIVCFAICLVSNIGIFIGTYVANGILINAFETILDTRFHDLQLISYMPSLVVKDLIYVAMTSLISFIIPQILLFRIRPIEIIRAKE